MTPEARRQLRLRYELAIAAADAYAREGFVSVVQDVVVGPVLGAVIGMSTTRPRHVVVLDPAPAEVERREAGRAKTGYGDGIRPADLVGALRRTTPRLGLWLDPTGQEPHETVRTILERLPEAVVDR